MIRHYLIIEEGELIVNRKECYNVPEFKVLFDRDKGSKTDLTGRNKYIACSELRYIFYAHEPRSEYYYAPKSLAHPIMLDLSGLPSTWKTDKVFEQAVEKYKTLQRLSSAGSAYFAADSALYEAGADTKYLAEIIKEQKEYLRGLLKSKSKASKEFSENDFTELTRIKTTLDGIMKAQNDQLAIIKRMPELSKTVKVLRENYSEEESDDHVMIGGGTKGNRED